MLFLTKQLSVVILDLSKGGFYASGCAAMSHSFVSMILLSIC